MKRDEKAALVLVATLGGSLLPLFPDPFYHEQRVSFWTWLGREIYELRFGEERRVR